MKRLTAVIGHYGSGKSTVAANLAVRAARNGERVRVVDMDVVNPYYRTSDLSRVFAREGVALTCPMYAGTNLDTPILDYDIESLYDNGERLIIDMGGDDAGAYPLGRYADFISAHSHETDILYVVNFRRFLTQTPDEALDTLREIEKACRLKATGIVDNTNLGRETTPLIIRQGIIKADELAVLAGLPVYCRTAPLIPLCEGFVCKDADVPVIPLEIYIIPDGFAFQG